MLSISWFLQHKRTHGSPLISFHLFRADWLSWLQTSYRSQIKPENPNVYSPEIKLFSSLCLLKPSLFPLHHFPPLLNKNCPLLPHRGVNMRKWLIHALLWLAEGNPSNYTAASSSNHRLQNRPRNTHYPFYYYITLKVHTHLQNQYVWPSTTKVKGSDLDM